MRRRQRTQHRQPPLLLPLLCQVLILTVSLLFVQGDPSLDYSCGLDWVNAANACSKHCPSGLDSECTDLGEGFGCYYFTGCQARFEELQKEQEEQAALEEENEEEVIVEVPPEQNQFCAPTFIEAMLTCPKEKACPVGNECGVGEECFGKTNCDRELKEVVSDMVFNLKGLPGIMEDEDLTIFSSVIFELLSRSLSEVKVHLDTITVTDQRYFFADENTEVSVFFTAKYRPPPRQKLDSIIENSINLQKGSVTQEIKKAGNDAKRWNFSKLDEITAVSRENATKRPTVSPTEAPTFSPTALPSAYPTVSPSGSPTSAPSETPSSSPSRMHIQEVTTATTQELKSSTDGSYGVVFNMRTVATGPVVLITGLDFYTESTEFVGFELWSRLGSFKDSKGTYEGWDLIASGVVKGAGYGKLTSIPGNSFTEVSIPGRGGERAFYLTLNQMDLIYRASEVESAESDSRIIASSSELEIYEGEAVLSYPFPDPAQEYLYRSPRLFVGAVQYDRIPCKPYSLYGPVIDLPCEEIPTMNPTKPPTKRPTPRPIATEKPTPDPDQTSIELPTMSPNSTESPSTSVSLAPTASASPTLSVSPTLYPTASPVVPIRAYIVVTLRRTLDRRMSAGEKNSFFDMFVAFLRKHSKVAMMVEKIDLWREEQVKVAAPNESNATSVTPVVATRSIEGLQTVQATKLTLVLKISSTTLPQNLLGNMAVVSIEENQEELLAEISVLGELYQFFENVDQVVSFSISSVSEAPVASPAGNESTNQVLTDGNIGEETSTQLGVVTGVTVAILWLLLASSSIFYLIKVRSKMKDHKLTSEEVEKIDPLKDLEADPDDEENGFRQSLRSSLSRSGGQRDLNMRGSLRDSLRRSNGQSNLRASLQRSDSQGNLRGSMRDSLRRSNGEMNLRASMQRSDSQGNLRESLRDSQHSQRSGDEGNLRGSMRDSLRRSNGQMNLRASMQRSDSQGNLRGSMRDSLRRSNGQMNLRASMQRSDSQGNLRGSMRDSLRRSNGQMNLRASMQRSDSQGNLGESLSDSQRSGDEGDLRGSMSMRDSLTRSDSNLRTSIQKSDSNGDGDNDKEIGLRSSLNRSGTQRDLNMRGSLRDSLRRSGGQSNLRASLQRSNSQGNLRGSLRDSQRSSGQNNRRVTVSRSDGQDGPRASLKKRTSRRNLRGSGNRGLTGSGNEDNLRGSGNELRGSGNGGLRGSGNEDDLRGSGNNLRGSGSRGLRGSGSEDDLRGSGNKLRGSGRRGLRGSSRNELAVSFSEDINNNVSEQRKKRNTDLSKSMNELVNWDVAQDADKRGDLHRSDSNIMTSAPTAKASNDNVRTIRRSTKKGRQNLAGLEGSVTTSNESTLRSSINGQRGDAPEGANTLTGSSSSPSRRGNNSLRRSASKRNIEDVNSARPSARSSGNNLRSSGGRGRRSALSQSMTALRSDEDNANKRPAGRLQSSFTEQSGRTRGNRTALSQSMTRRTSVDNDRSGNRLRNSTGSPKDSGDNLVNGPRSRKERPDYRLRSSSIEQRNYNSLRASSRAGMQLSKSMKMSGASDVNADRRSGTRDGKQSDSKFGDLVRQASARRSNRQASGDRGGKDIEALKRNLIL